MSLSLGPVALPDGKGSLAFCFIDVLRNRCRGVMRLIDRYADMKTGELTD